MHILREHKNKKVWLVGEKKYEWLKGKVPHEVLGIVRPSLYFRRKTLFCLDDEILNLIDLLDSLDKRQAVVRVRLAELVRFQTEIKASDGKIYKPEGSERG